MAELNSAIRVYITGQVRVEAQDALVGEPDLPGRQGRLLLAMLVAERHRPLSRDELADELWGQTLPPAWDKGLRALVSKLRRALLTAGLDSDTVAHSFGCYQLHLPLDAWVDAEAADSAVHAAEVALAAGHADDAYGWAYVGYHISRRPFLTGEDGRWATRFRSHLNSLQLRALDSVVECNAAQGTFAEAVRAAEEALVLDPLREVTYQRYMRALAVAGNRVDALRVWERCRKTLDDELGVRPSPQTEAVYLDLLRG